MKMFTLYKSVLFPLPMTIKVGKMKFTVSFEGLNTVFVWDLIPVESKDNKCGTITIPKSNLHIPVYAIRIIYWLLQPFCYWAMLYSNACAVS